MEKYNLIKEMLLTENIVKSEKDFISPTLPSKEDLLLVHAPEYLDKLEKDKLSYYERAALEVPFSKELYLSACLSCAGTALACKYAIERKGCGVNIGGGFHHAFPKHGEGFCVLNDIAVGIRKVQKEKGIKKTLVIDCDLHQGNGTAAIFHGDSSVFTFSIHEENNYPSYKPESDLDIGLASEVGDDEYLSHLEANIPNIMDEFKPELVIYLAGVDPYYKDQLGKLMLTENGLMLRDKFILENCKNRDIPVVIVLGGGYAPNLQETARLHFNTIKVAHSIFSGK
jgi:acetoin utilization deacetylase AcuC-like enzyme